ALARPLEPPAAEVLAVDGGSTDASIAIAEAAGLLDSCGAPYRSTYQGLAVFDSAKYRDPLNLDQHFLTCETSDGNQRTRRKIIAEDLLSQLSKAVTIAGVGDEHG